MSLQRNSSQLGPVIPFFPFFKNQGPPPVSNWASMAITEESQLDYLPLREDPEEHKVLFLFLLLLLVVVTLRFESEIPVPVFTVITVYIIILFTFPILLPHPGIKPYQYCTWLVGPYLGPNVLLQPYMRIFEMHYLSHQTAPRPRQSRLILFCTKMHLD